MQLADYFEDVVVLGADAPGQGRVDRRLRELGREPWSVDLSGTEGWRGTLTQALTRARQARAPGVLLLLSQVADDGAFWRSQDCVVEHLDSQAWDIVYLGHGDGDQALCDGDRPGLVHCDMPPRDVTAIAVSCAVLDTLIQTMPEHACDGPLAPRDWLAIACWLAVARVRPESGWAAWPPLMH